MKSVLNLLKSNSKYISLLKTMQAAAGKAFVAVLDLNKKTVVKLGRASGEMYILELTYNGSPAGYLKTNIAPPDNGAWKDLLELQLEQVMAREQSKSDSRIVDIQMAFIEDIIEKTSSGKPVDQICQYIKQDIQPNVFEP